MGTMNDDGDGPQRIEREKLTPNELDDPAAVLGFQFVQRWDLYARQLDDGRYICVREPLRHEQIVAHLAGEMTLGMYVLNDQSHGRHLILDADDDPGWRRIQALAKVLAALETTAYLERSRRGGHLWLFFSEPLPGETIRRFGQGLMLYFKFGGLELFPKQSALSGGPGSLIRMPFGIHRKSGRRYGFYLAHGRPLAAALREQISALENPQTVPQAVVERFCALVPATGRRAVGQSKAEKTIGRNGKELPLHERIKAAISVRDFVSHYVDLSASGSGLCPFHDDQMASFSVNNDRNFWHCFACETGGSIIDFWMNYRECEFKVAVEELADMLL
jgi:hypothetical protein